MHSGSADGAGPADTNQTSTASSSRATATTSGRPLTFVPSGSHGKGRRGSKRKSNDEDEDDSGRRRCVSTACIACRKRKSKCDGNTPACAACSQVYGTECVYDPNSDHRRKGVYKQDTDNLKTRNSTLHTLIQAILNYPEDEVLALVREIRTCESLDAVADNVIARGGGVDAEAEDDDDDATQLDVRSQQTQTFESQLYGKMGDLRLDEGSVRYIGGTSNLIYLAPQDSLSDSQDEYLQHEDPVTSWTTVTDDAELVVHLLNMYFTWHYTFFTTLSKKLFYRDFLLGCPPTDARRKANYCTPLLVNAILALGCHFTSHSGARDNPNDSATAGDHFFREAKRLIMENDEHERPLLTTVQALALMSVREAGCGREARGWVYSGMSFRMALDMGLNLDGSQLTNNKDVGGDEVKEDVRRITFWGCFLFDKCWSNYLGRLPQLPTSLITVSKYEVFPDEEADQWSPYTDSGFVQANAQPARTRAVALQVLKLCEISNDLMKYFYNPSDMEKIKGKAAELRKLSEIHTRLEAWRRELTAEMEPREGGLSSVLVMHMLFQLLFIHLFRPFLKYTHATSPLPQTVSPRKLCTQAAAMISKLMRLYKRSHGLRQICNIAVYIAHSACTIHLLNLPDKHAKRDITHGVKHLEEIAECWPGARRTLGILSTLASKWNVELPEEAALVLARTDAKFGRFQSDLSSPSSPPVTPPTMPVPPMKAQQQQQQKYYQQQQQEPQSQHSWQVPTTLPQAPYAFPITPVSNPATAVNTSGYAQSEDDNLMSMQQAQRARQSPTSAVQMQPLSQLQTWNPGKALRARGSPSDIFGGVEQLIREGNEWAYRDQTQLATGFDNWSTPEIEPQSWSGGGIAHDGRISISIENGPGEMADQSSVIMMPPAIAAFDDSIGQTADGQNTLMWLNSMQSYGSIASTYNETEWYQ